MIPAARMQATRENCRELGHVGLVMGGQGAEREVSLDGGQAVAEALGRLGVEYTVFDGPTALLDAVGKGGISRVFNLLHGRGGEDGQLQGALAIHDVPVTGSGILGSAASMDKVATKWLWRGGEIPTPDFMILDTGTESARPDTDTIIDRLGLPLFVKPAREGSSVGMSRVAEAVDLEPAVAEARRFDHKVLLEAFVSGPEYTVGLLEGTALPIIRIETEREFYDYTAKYEDDDTRYLIPSGLDHETEREIQALAGRAFEVLGGQGWGRVDLMLDSQGRPWFIDANTTPGMTSHSLVPKAAAEAGLDFDQLVWRILLTSLGAR